MPVCTKPIFEKKTMALAKNTKTIFYLYLTRTIRLEIY